MINAVLRPKVLTASRRIFRLEVVRQRRRRLIGAAPRRAALREHLLDDVLEAVARLGLGNLSLRALARQLNVSPRMLLYHFDSREGLLDAIVAEASRRLAAAALLVGTLPEIIETSRLWMTAPHQRGFPNVFYEVRLLGARDPTRRATVASSLFGDWHELLVQRGVADASATMILATLHGLPLDLVLSADSARIQRAFIAFVATLTSQNGVSTPIGRASHCRQASFSLIVF